MAGRSIALSLGILLLTMQLWMMVMAQSDCSTVLLTLSPCLDYMSSKSPTPSQQCCSQFESVVRSAPMCLCQVLEGGGSSFGVELNQTRALELPAACKIEAPPASHCNATSPTTAPLGSEEPATPSTSGESGSESGSGTSNGSSMKVSMSSLFFFLLAASFFFHEILKSELPATLI